MNEPQKMTVEELLEGTNPILPSPEVSTPKLYDMVMRQNTGGGVFKDMVNSKTTGNIFTPKPKIEFIPFNNISINHKKDITNNNLFELLFDIAINMNIINKNIENIINHINNE